MACNVRWAFNVKKWAPTSEELLKCVTFIQAEEKERIGRFFFKEDFKSSLIGRLLMRKFVSETTKLPYNEIVFERDEKGKPIIGNPNLECVKFNVSHQGDYVVLAGSNEVEKLGVDVMKMEYRGGKELSDFFRIMNRQFTESEWITINQGTDQDKVKTFTRHWCLKESYVKAIGTGLNLNLQRINFQIKHRSLKQAEIISDTDLFVDGEKMDWEFHESLLDETHCVVVALTGSNLTQVIFQEICIDELLEKGIAMNSEDPAYCKNYFGKMEKS